MTLIRRLSITVVQSLHTPTETQEPSPGAQQGGWEEQLILLATRKLFYTLNTSEKYYPPSSFS